MSEIRIETLDGGEYPYKWLNPPERLGSDSYKHSDWEISFAISDTEWVEIGTFPEKKAKKLHAKLLEKIRFHLSFASTEIEAIENGTSISEINLREWTKDCYFRSQIPFYIKISDLLKEIEEEA
jgi:hypothetical protein